MDRNFELKSQIHRKLIGVLNQQINVVSTHLHNLELVQQGQTARLPDSEEMASDVASLTFAEAEGVLEADAADAIPAVDDSAVDDTVVVVPNRAARDEDERDKARS